jgi:hypothetical protein
MQIHCAAGFNALDPEKRRLSSIRHNAARSQ